MIPHPDLTGSRNKLHVEDLLDEARANRRALSARRPEKSFDIEPGHTVERPNIELSFWKRWRVRRRPAFGAG